MDDATTSLTDRPMNDTAVTRTRHDASSQTYPRYKDSGVEWLGEIPESWRTVALKYVTQFVNGASFSSTDWQSQGIPIIRISNLNDDEDFNFVDENQDVPQRYHIGEGDLLFAWSGNRGTSFGPYVWNRPGLYYLNQHIFKLTEFDLYHRYLYWILKGVTNFVEKQAHGIIGMVHITKSSLGAIKVPVVPIEEQRAIAAFLDRETEKIDALIEKKQRLIERLEEKRTALISHTVTKGLDPDAEMKDSGVEWLGEIPVGWGRAKIRHICQVSRGASPRPIDDPKYFDKDGEYAWVRISDVTASNKYLTETEQTLSEKGQSKSVSIEPGELFLSIAATVGKPIITKIKCCIHDGFVYFNNLDENKDFIYYLFLGGELYKGVGKKGTQLNLNTDSIGDITIPLPPLSEQFAIAAFLDRETESMDAMIEKVRNGISRLQEYRTALISAAVTGTIDVRPDV